MAEKFFPLGLCIFGLLVESRSSKYANIGNKSLDGVQTEMANLYIYEISFEETVTNLLPLLNGLVQIRSSVEENRHADGRRDNAGS